MAEASRYRIKVIKDDLGTEIFQTQWKDPDGNWWDYVWDPINDPVPINFVHKEDAMAYLMKRKQQDEEEHSSSGATITYIYI